MTAKDLIEKYEKDISETRYMINYTDEMKHTFSDGFYKSEKGRFNNQLRLLTQFITELKQLDKSMENKILSLESQLKHNYSIT